MPKMFFPLICLCVVGVVPARLAAAQDWPVRPVTMVIPFAPGGALDVLGRILQPGLSEALRVQVVIENVGGAGGHRNIFSSFWRARSQSGLPR